LSAHWSLRNISSGSGWFHISRHGFDNSLDVLNWSFVSGKGLLDGLLDNRGGNRHVAWCSLDEVIGAYVGGPDVGGDWLHCLHWHGSDSPDWLLLYYAYW